MYPPTRPSHTRLSCELKGAEIILPEGEKKNTAAPGLVKSQWLAAIQSHRGERWPDEWGGRGCARGSPASPSQPARPGPPPPPEESRGPSGGAPGAAGTRRSHWALFASAALGEATSEAELSR